MGVNRREGILDLYQNYTYVTHKYKSMGFKIYLKNTNLKYFKGSDRFL